MNKERLFESLGEQDTATLLDLTAYITAVAQTASPDEFAGIVVPLAQRDSYHSLTGEVYATASRLASAAQKEKLDAEIKRLNVRTILL